MPLRHLARSLKMSTRQFLALRPLKKGIMLVGSGVNIKIYD